MVWSRYWIQRIESAGPNAGALLYQPVTVWNENFASKPSGMMILQPVEKRKIL
jgi:hypothetical protein